MTKRPITVHYKVREGLSSNTVFKETPNEYDTYIMPSVNEYVSFPEEGIKDMKVIRIKHKISENKHDIFITISE